MHHSERPRPWLKRATANDTLRSLVFLLMLFIGGCAFTTGHVDVAYQADATATKVAEADSPHVMVEVADKRTTQVVGQKMNGLGMKTADIVSDADVPATVKNAFDTELSNRGFTLGSGGNVVAVQLSLFQSQFNLGLVKGDATGNVGMDVAVKKPDGSSAYDKYIIGQGKDWIEISGAGNAEHVLGLALKNAISNVFADPNFIAALKK